MDKFEQRRKSRYKDEEVAAVGAFDGWMPSGWVARGRGGMLFLPGEWRGVSSMAVSGPSRDPPAVISEPSISSSVLLRKVYYCSNNIDQNQYGLERATVAGFWLFALDICLLLCGHV